MPGDMPSASRTKQVAIVLAVLPGCLWFALYLWDPGATLLPVLALLWSIPAALGWRYPNAAGFLLLAISALGLLTAGVALAFSGAWWFALIPLVLFCALPLVSALLFFVAAHRAKTKEAVVSG